MSCFFSLLKSAIGNLQSLINLSSRSVILGGSNNEVSGAVSLAFGAGVTVDSSFVTAFYNSTNTGKVGINEPNPTAELHVEGTVKISNILHLKPLASTPALGNQGDICVTTSGQLWFYDGDDWKEVQLAE